MALSSCSPVITNGGMNLMPDAPHPNNSNPFLNALSINMAAPWVFPKSRCRARHKPDLHLPVPMRGFTKKLMDGDSLIKGPFLETLPDFPKGKSLKNLVEEGTLYTS